MQGAIENQVVIVRGTPEYRDYLIHQHGWVKGVVNWCEETMAITGRLMLLAYIVYITVKAGSSWDAPLPLDVFMLALQVLGLEGSVPGLIHLSERLESEGKTKSANMVRRSATIAQFLVVATALDIVLQSLQKSGFSAWGLFDFSSLATGYTNTLLILRVVVIGFYLIAMARLEHKGPKIISKEEAKKIDMRDALKVENGQFRQKIDELNKALLQAKEELQEVSLQAKSEAEKNASLQSSLQASLQAPAASEVPTSAFAPSRVKRSKKNAPRAFQKSAANVSLMISRDQVKQALAEDPSLLTLSEKKIADQLGASSSTVHRALEEYRSEHPEALGGAIQ